MAVRLKDIARDLDVSVITVSKVLRGAPDIGEATRQRVLARAKALDYQPNMAARSLATGRSSIVGLIVPDLLNPFFTELASSLAGALRQRSYGLILASSENDAAIERSEVRMVLARGVDALLLASCRTATPAKPLSHLRPRDTPLVLLNRPLPGVRAAFVGSDEYAGGRLAAEHLLEIGRKRLAYIGSPEPAGAPERLRGFRQTLSERGVKLREDLVVSSGAGDGAVREPLQHAGDNAGYVMMQRLLKKRSRPNGVFCHNDLLAIGAMKATLDAGLSIPGEIAFVGCDNVSYSRYLQIPLTSVDQSTGQMGEAAARLALDLLARKPVKTKTVLLPPKLVVRQSTAGAVAGPASAIG